MKFLHMLQRKRHIRSWVSRDRARFEQSMPGETGALAALRFGFLIN